jgi:hypothetical protein
MFTNTTSGMSVTVSGGTAEENNQFCTAFAAGLRMIGFNNVQLDSQYEYPVNTQYDGDLLNAMHQLNPDLFDTPVAIVGESEDDMRGQMLAMGLPAQPFAFQIESAGFF